MKRRPAILSTLLLVLVLQLLATATTLAQPGADAAALETATPDLGLELLFSESDIARIRANARSPIFKDYWDRLLQMDASEDGNFYREAFLYVITGDVKRGENAKRLMMETVRQEHWNNFVDGNLPLGFLQDGRLTAWTALGYDWLYGLLSEQERAEIRGAIAEKGCVPLYRALHGMRYPETVKGWAFAPYTAVPEKKHIDMTRWPHILGHNNFRAIINGGLTLGLLALEGRDNRVDEWKDMVLDSIERFSGMFKDDGSYEEGVSYLNYAMTYEVYAMEAARRKMDVNFFDSANFDGMMQFVLVMYMPSHLFGNGSLTFGDGGPSMSSSTAFWVARQGRDGLAQYIGLNYADHDIFSLVYYDPSNRPEEPNQDSHFVETDMDWIISRSGFGMDDYVVGMRSGPPSNHEHGDRNSIQLKAYGEILLADHRHLAYWSSDPEWIMRTSHGHNTVSIDGVGSQYHNGEEGTNESKSHAKIVRAFSRRGYHFWASDATQAYKLLTPDTKSVTRSIISFPDVPAIVVIDKVMKETTPSQISARWQLENENDGQATLSVGDGSFTIKRPHGRLYAAVAGDSDQQISPGEFDSANKEYPFTYVDVTDGDRRMHAFKLMVGVPLRPEEPDPIIDFSREGQTWTIHLNKNGSEIAVKVLDKGALPEFEVLRNDF